MNMKFISTDMVFDEVSRQNAVKVLLLRKDLEYIGAAMTQEMNKQFNLEDPSKQAEFQELNILYTDIYRAWEATDPNPENRVPLDKTKIITTSQEPSPDAIIPENTNEPVTDFISPPPAEPPKEADPNEVIPEGTEEINTEDNVP